MADPANTIYADISISCMYVEGSSYGARTPVIRLVFLRAWNFSCHCLLGNISHRRACQIQAFAN